MAIGAKRYETRSRMWKLRGEDLAICSTKKFDAICRRIAYHQEPFRTVLAGAHLIPTQTHGMVPESLPLGVVLCVVEVYDIAWTDDFIRSADRAMLPLRTIKAQEWEFGDYLPDRIVYLTRRLRKLKNPVPVHGRQGLFNLSDEVEAQVRSQIK